MSNFNFLKDIKPELAQFGKSAELYCHDDRQAALVKLRCFTEMIVGDIYSRLSLTPPVRDDLYNRLRERDFKDVVGDLGIWAKLDVLRHKGNKAAHSIGGIDDISIDETLWLIKEAYLVARWYAQVFLISLSRHRSLLTQLNLLIIHLAWKPSCYGNMKQSICASPN